MFRFTLLSKTDKKTIIAAITTKHDHRERVKDSCLLSFSFVHLQLKVYHAVIEDVISNVRDAFLDEGVDEQVLQEMKQIWRNKLLASKAVELNPEPGEAGHHPPPIVANNPKVSKVCNRCQGVSVHPAPTS